MLSKSVRTVFTIIGSIVILGAIIIAVLTLIGKSPIKKFQNNEDEKKQPLDLYTANEFGDQVVNTEALRENIVDVSESGEVTPTDEFFDGVKTFGFGELNEASPELVANTSIQKTEDSEKVREIDGNRESANITVLYTTSLSSESAFVYRRDMVTIVNQSGKNIDVKNLTTGNDFSVEADMNLSFTFDYLGEFKFEIDGKAFSVFVSNPPE